MQRSLASISNMPHLYYLLRGIRRIQGATFHRTPRRPITVRMLLLIFRRLPLMSYTALEKSMFKAAITLAFFGMLRVSEYTSVRRFAYDSHSTLLCQDITFNSNHSIMTIFVRASKTDPFREGCCVRVGVLCPVRAMREYLAMHPSGSGPLFVTARGHYLLRQDIVTLLERCLPGITDVNTHSFRIGGASAAASAGIADSQIQIMGIWSSGAY